MQYLCPRCGRSFRVKPPEGTCPQCNAALVSESESHDGERESREGQPLPPRRRL
ncbi:hypothetical protein HRbin30_01119 [bacterium HR30]|nr:hypothetical protein HRbin30_01119 [bacterium HR30]